jgi:hypothetical protein
LPASAGQLSSRPLGSGHLSTQAVDAYDVMMATKRIHTVAFHLLLGALTDLCLLALGLLLLLAFGFRGMPLTVLAGVFLIDGLLYALAAGLLSRWARHPSVTRLVGWGPGRIIGVGVGAMLGGRIGGLAGSIVGAIALYFAGRSLGSWISMRLAGFLTLYFTVDEPQEHPRVSPRLRRLGLAYFFGLPLLIMATIVLLRIQNLDFGLTVGAMPMLQLAALAYSLLALALIPRIAGNISRRLGSQQKGPIHDPNQYVYLVAMAFSEVPAILGLVLFILGGPIFVSGAFCALTLILLSVHTLRRLRRTQPAA